MATAAELVMAPSAARPETAGARKDAPDAAGETSFAEVLDNEVQAASDAGTASGASASTAAATQAVTPQVQPSPSPAAMSAVELLISLQSADAPVAQPDITDAEGTPATPKAAPAVAPMVTPVIETTEPALAEAMPAPANAQQTDAATALSPASTEFAATPQSAAADVAAPAVVAMAPKTMRAVVADAQDEPGTKTDATAAAEPSSTDAKTLATGVDPAVVIATPAESSATTPATAPARASIAMAAAPAPRPITSTTTQSNNEKSAKVQPAAGREATAADAPAVSSKYAPPDPNASSASQTATSAVKPQTGVQTVAADAIPDIKTDAPAPASSSTSTSFADLLARGAPADTGKPAATHPAMQSAPQAAVQVYSRIVERFDGRAQRFEVRLDPAELGRVDVRIEIGTDKKVHAVLAAHDSAALSDLMRGQRALERALADAGIDLKDGGLKFELANDFNRGLAGQEQRRDAWSAEETNVWRGFSTVDVPVEASADATIAANAYPWRATRFDLVA